MWDAMIARDILSNIDRLSDEREALDIRIHRLEGRECPQCIVWSEHVKALEEHQSQMTLDLRSALTLAQDHIRALEKRLADTMSVDTKLSELPTRRDASLQMRVYLLLSFTGIFLLLYAVPYAIKRFFPHLSHLP